MWPDVGRENECVNKFNTAKHGMSDINTVKWHVITYMPFVDYSMYEVVTSQILCKRPYNS